MSASATLTGSPPVVELTAARHLPSLGAVREVLTRDGIEVRVVSVFDEVAVLEVVLGMQAKPS